MVIRIRIQSRLVEYLKHLLPIDRMHLLVLRNQTRMPSMIQTQTNDMSLTIPWRS